ncbi:hypothetical protein STBHUCCB_45110 [Salmonella enterica subsp. enterica serovar Typhi str. P-stx-12]|nr:hypothetical protein STBHUCCB_45110 [Salmonella enterica subsp. enterica serovar Typhi str. P-stx-12]AGK69768.1 hypothetical protein TY21A_21690 [Salmonella enterica subsp. enterica serovar Typhi str. Ty21a]AXR58810.1 hypothetical protein CJP42_0622 [Salmonella enterica subsp. enterica serovar Typhi]
MRYEYRKKQLSKFSTTAQATRFADPCFVDLASQAFGFSAGILDGWCFY